ncbi:MAG TPA: alpha/beta hydrolase [Actinomycetales bacterium]|nr:alpha/beta hydrolase [Actinomycetales bacterium]
MPLRHATLTATAALVAAAALAGAGPAASSAPAATAAPIDHTNASGGMWNLMNPGKPWPGTDDWSCRPPAEHPNPVILVHGLGANGLNQWSGMAPSLVEEGYCVYAPTWGALPDHPGIGSRAPFRESQAEMADYVDRVLTATGAQKVDLVGLSAGVPVVAHLAKVDRPGKVGRAVLMAGNLYGDANKLPGTNPETAASVENAFRSSPLGAGLTDEAFTAETWKGGTPFHPETEYTILAGIHDQASPPSAAFVHVPGATQIVIQDGCPENLADHVSFAVDPRAIDHTLNALDPENAVTPRCLPTLPIIGLLGPVPPRG